MRHTSAPGSETRDLVCDLASLGQQLLGLQAQLAQLEPQAGADPRVRRSLARSRTIVDQLHLRAWSAGVGPMDAGVVDVSDPQQHRSSPAEEAP